MVVGPFMQGMLLLGIIYWYTKGMMSMINDYYRSEFQRQLKDDGVPGDGDVDAIVAYNVLKAQQQQQQQQHQESVLKALLPARGPMAGRTADMSGSAAENRLIPVESILSTKTRLDTISTVTSIPIETTGPIAISGPTTAIPAILKEATTTTIGPSTSVSTSSTSTSQLSTTTLDRYCALVSPLQQFYHLLAQLMPICYWLNADGTTRSLLA